jgi:hypothetical protein
MERMVKKDFKTVREQIKFNSLEYVTLGDEKKCRKWSRSRPFALRIGSFFIEFVGIIREGLINRKKLA